MNPGTPRPRFTGLLAALLTIGFGLTAYYGMAWYELPRYSDADITASAELNLMMDLQRREGAPPSAAELDGLRRQVRAEIEADIAQERRGTQTGFAIGLSALLLGLGQMMLARRSSMRR